MHVYALMFVGLQTPTAFARDPATWTVTSENDSPWSLMWNNVYRDEYYTNGIRLSRSQDLSERADGLLVGFVRAVGMEQAEQLQIAVSQTMYTPIEIWEPTIPASSHPYAGHLFFSGGLSATRTHLLGSLELLGGWSGPPALGEPTQKKVHVLFNGYEPPFIASRQSIRFQPSQCRTSCGKRTSYTSPICVASM